jgi:hypothetical protein
MQNYMRKLINIILESESFPPAPEGWDKEEWNETQKTHRWWKSKIKHIDRSEIDNTILTQVGGSYEHFRFAFGEPSVGPLMPDEITGEYDCEYWLEIDLSKYRSWIDDPRDPNRDQYAKLQKKSDDDDDFDDRQDVDPIAQMSTGARQLMHPKLLKVCIAHKVVANDPNWTMRKEVYGNRDTPIWDVIGSPLVKETAKHTVHNILFDLWPV